MCRVSPNAAARTSLLIPSRDDSGCCTGCRAAGCSPSSSRLLAAGHDDFSGADGLDDLVLGEHRDGGIDLGAVAGDHEDHGSRREVHGFPSEVLGGISIMDNG